MKKILLLTSLILLLSSCGESEFPVYKSEMNREAYADKFLDWLNTKIENADVNPRKSELADKEFDDLNKQFRQDVLKLEDKQAITERTDAFISQSLKISEKVYGITYDDWLSIFKPKMDNTARKSTQIQLKMLLKDIMRSVPVLTTQSINELPATTHNFFKDRAYGTIYYHLLKHSKYPEFIAYDGWIEEYEHRKEITDYAVNISLENNLPLELPKYDYLNKLSQSINQLMLTVNNIANKYEEGGGDYRSFSTKTKNDYITAYQKASNKLRHVDYLQKTIIKNRKSKHPSAKSWLKGNEKELAIALNKTKIEVLNKIKNYDSDKLLFEQKMQEIQLLQKEHHSRVNLLLKQNSIAKIVLNKVLQKNSNKTIVSRSLFGDRCINYRARNIDYNDENIRNDAKKYKNMSSNRCLDEFIKKMSFFITTENRNASVLKIEAETKMSTKKNENKPLYYCKTTNEKQVLVEQKGEIVSYVFGKDLNNPELSLKKEISNVSVQRAPLPGGGELIINIKNEEYNYKLRSGMRRICYTEDCEATHEDFGSILVFEGDKKLTEIPCDVSTIKIGDIDSL